MTQAHYLTAPTLAGLNRIVHGFFTRQGGHSDGLYASLNTGLGSGDCRQTVLANRARVTDVLDVDAALLATPYQIHSADVDVVDQGWFQRPRPRVDALVTTTPGIALGVGSADCCPILFADATAGVIGAAHSGWRGAIAGVAANTIDVMVENGARVADIWVVLGPTISQSNYEVGPEFQASFVQQSASNAAFFRPSERPGHFLFSLTDYIVASLKEKLLAGCDVLKVCTYADEDRFFSYRRMTHRKEADYGRQISAIALNS